MYKEDLALNNLQWLICHKNQTKPIINVLKANESVQIRIIDNLLHLLFNYLVSCTWKNVQFLKNNR